MLKRVFENYVYFQELFLVVGPHEETHELYNETISFFFLYYLFVRCHLEIGVEVLC